MSEENSLEQILKELRIEEKSEIPSRRRKEEIERVSTGIEDLDRALEGGVPKGTWVVVTGEPGTGKSILSMHFAWAGLRNNEPIVYVTTEAEFRDVIKQAKQFGMEFGSYATYNLGSSKEPIGTPQLVVIDIFGLLKTARQLTQESWSSEEMRRRRYAALEIPTLVAAIQEAYRILGVISDHSKSPRKHVRLVIDSMSAFWADRP
ncbi:MAG: recombinase RecA, partial [Thermoprotei archaeon]